MLCTSVLKDSALAIPEVGTIQRRQRKYEKAMEQKKETNEVRYSVARKLLNLILENGFISEEEYKKIDALNRETFSPELSKVYG